MKSTISMKKYISLILTGLLLGVMVNAQNPETLTNSSVIRMSKANLSDALITDMIENSPVKFDLSANALKNLEGEGVSPVVVQSMKTAAAKKPEAETSAPSQEKVITPPPVASVQETIGEPPYEPSKTRGTISLEALNYVAPIADLIKFNDNQFKGLEITISEWDSQVRGYISDISKVKEQMLQVERELRMKKNADTEVFSEDIKSLKEKLEAYRKNYKQSKDIMIKGGGTIIKNLESMSSDVSRDMSKAYSDASQKVGSVDADPASGKQAITLSYPTREVSDKSVSYIVYLNEMLAWHQNEISELAEVIDAWNPRVTKLISEDEQLRIQIEPVEKRIQELSANSKQNKTEISALKKQVSDLEKSRKKLADQMKSDAKELASYIKQVSQKNQESLEERFTDIIENITYSFGEKLSM
ncbi:hypothetical protein EG830_00855 [bacterium]|nr:hypothetical protein [bacterium]